MASGREESCFSTAVGRLVGHLDVPCDRTVITDSKISPFNLFLIRNFILLSSFELNLISVY